MLLFCNVKVIRFYQISTFYLLIFFDAIEKFVLDAVFAFQFENVAVFELEDFFLYSFIILDLLDCEFLNNGFHSWILLRDRFGFRLILLHWFNLYLLSFVVFDFQVLNRLGQIFLYCFIMKGHEICRRNHQSLRFILISINRE